MAGNLILTKASGGDRLNKITDKTRPDRNSNEASIVKLGTSGGKQAGAPKPAARKQDSIDRKPFRSL